MSRVEAGSRLAASLGFFWVVRGRGRENLPRVMALVALTEPGTAPRARAVTAAAHVRGLMLGEDPAALPFAEEGLSISRTLGDAQGLAVALVRRGQIAIRLGDYQLATAVYAEARALFRALGGVPGPENSVTVLMGNVAQAEGDVERAQPLYDEGLAEARARGDGHAVAHILRLSAGLRRAQGDDERAFTLLRESASVIVPLKDVRCAYSCLEDFAAILSTSGQPSDVARLFGAAEALREVIGIPLAGAQLAFHDRGVAAVKHRLDPDAFATAWAEGRAMTLERAIAYALERPAPV